MTDQRRFRYIEQAAEIADQLDQYAAAGNGQRYDGGGRSGDASTKAPVRIDVTSAVHDHDRDQIQELAIRQAILEPLDGPGLYIPRSDRAARGALLAQLLDEEDDLEPVAGPTTVAMRRHYTVLVCVLADAEGHVRLRCPRNHAPAEDIPTRTVVPAAMLDIPTGLVVCVHPECDETPGVPRLLNLVQEMLTNDPEALLGYEEVALLLGISIEAAKAKIRRAREKGHDVPAVDYRISSKGQKQALHRLTDLIKANNIARDLGLPDWPKQSRRRGRPNPGT